MINLDACLGPDNSWFLLQGIETLPLRMERHVTNALTTARHLQTHPSVTWVRAPCRQVPVLHQRRSRGVLHQRRRGGRPQKASCLYPGHRARWFIEALLLFSHLANVGDIKSLAIHPASTTHSQLTLEQQAAGCIWEDLVRLSVDTGIKHIDDIVTDLDHALASAAAN